MLRYFDLSRTEDSLFIMHEAQPLIRGHRSPRPSHRWLALAVAVVTSCVLLSLPANPAKPPTSLATVPPLASVRVEIVANASSPRGYSAVAVFGEATDNHDGFAFATFNDSVAAVGWSQLWVRAASSKYAERDLNQVMFAAGFAEGALTHTRIDEHYLNTYESFYGADTVAPPKVAAWLAAHLEFLRARTTTAHHDPHTARYWAMVGGVLAQIEGLAAGYEAHRAAGATPLSVLDLFFLNSDGDLEDLIPAVNATDAAVRKEGSDEGAGSGSGQLRDLTSLKCSGLIRLLPDASDVLWGHTTWDIYSAMNKMFKHYDVPLPEGGARRVSMSSSPGYISSVDDWYLLDSGLAVLETTNGVYDKSLYSRLSTRSVLSWMRSKVANALATDGATWAQTFTRRNSGTYNNQWMVLDLHRFTPGIGFATGGLTVLEQMPGAVESRDVTDVLAAQGYWASYNVPYFPVIFNATGFQAKYNAQRTADWTYNHTARAEMFARDAPKIATIDDLKRVMRYNDYQHDPLSHGNPAWAVAARYDLATGDAFKLHGGIDTKVSSYQRALRLECDAILGPTRQQQSTFVWTSAFNAPHRGQPAEFAFGFVTMRHEDHIQS
ncbi:phospholipase B-like protein [Achlya hypogyna]|uniref:Phospholipase B-like n=1 Tax=Achlya hypogyna TaxID=1202772 RepID=A0A1V9YVR0_ACHHY|nr:phospholipase B-like protein [Achlya hypogyna]